jgi:HPt (histidine-containing phosphotransfer) domain-containing protein
MSESTDDRFDPAAIALLRRVGKDALVARMVGMFVTNAPARLAAIQAALDTGDADGLVRAAHSLKSSAGQLGAVHLQGMLAAIEADAKTATGVDRLRAAIADVERELARAIDWLNGQTTPGS